jgi:uncharacterized protein
VTFASTDFGFILSLEPGDELVRCVIQFAREHEVESAVLTGIGSTVEVELGFGSSSRSHERRRVLSEPLEACCLTGTVTLLDGEPFPHLHGTFARADASVVGGHVYQAVCGRTFQLAVRVSGEPPSGRDTMFREPTPLQPVR